MMTRSACWKAGAVLSAISATVLLSSQAHAVYQCGDTQDTCICGLDNPFPCCSNGGNCTWYAFHAACCGWKVAVPMRGHAKTWAGVARSDPNYEVIPYPVVNSIGCTETTEYGHVAWVTAVSGASITVHEQNCGGNYGANIRNTNAAEFNAYIIRQGQLCECHAGETQTQSCGDCGNQVRSCGADCKWAAWGACQATQIPADACNTGLPGACAAGTLSCVDGNTTCNQTVEPAAELCDNIDNNCDGQVDEGNVCAALPVDSGADIDSSSGKRDSSLSDSVSDEPATDSSSCTNPDCDCDGTGCACTIPKTSTRRGSFGLLLTWLVGLMALRARFGSRRHEI